MRLTPYRFTLSLRIKGPLITNSSSLGGFGIDMHMAQSGSAYYLPGTQVEGLLRMALEQLRSAGVDPVDIESLMGSASVKDTDDAPQRGRLYIQDLIDARPLPPEVLYRIAVDEDTGAAESTKLLVMETPYGFGTTSTFTGDVYLLLKPDEKAGEIALAVGKGLRWVAAVGAERSTGFGRVEAVQTTPPTEMIPGPMGSGGDFFELEIRPHGPFCVAMRRVANNVFESAEDIPGAAMKACVARLLDSSGPGNDQLHRVRFSTAKWGNGVGPLSKVRFGRALDDAIEKTEAYLSDDGEAPAFRLDWKGDDSETPLARELRIHTAISPVTGRAADEQLYAYRMIVPEGKAWKACVDLSQVKDPKAREEILSVLSLGLIGLGKTKVFADVTVRDAEPESAALSAGARVVVTLQTPALLLDPGSGMFKKNVLDGEEMRAAYKSLWEGLSGRRLTLVNYFQQNRLAGGEYFARRFQKVQNGRTYKPYLLTTERSTFLLEVRDEGAQACLAEWLRRGLPIPPAACEFYGLNRGDQAADWERCPYVRENGYGEIAVREVKHAG